MYSRFRTPAHVGVHRATPGIPLRFILEPLGFPPTHLGLRCFVAATRASGTQRAAAALGQMGADFQQDI